MHAIIVTSWFLGKNAAIKSLEHCQCSMVLHQESCKADSAEAACMCIKPESNVLQTQPTSTLTSSQDQKCAYVRGCRHSAAGSAAQGCADCAKQGGLQRSVLLADHQLPGTLGQAPLGTRRQAGKQTLPHTSAVQGLLTCFTRLLPAAALMLQLLLLLPPSPPPASPSPAPPAFKHSAAGRPGARLCARQ